MNNYSFHAVKTFNNNLSRSRLITIEHEGKRSDAILSVIAKDESLHDHYLIDAQTKCNITFDFTVKIKTENSHYNSDYELMTFNDLKKLISEINSRPDFDSVVRQPFVRFHYSKSGRAIDYLELEKILQPHNVQPHDGGLFYDSSLLFEVIKHKFTRNEFNEVVYNG